MRPIVAVTRFKNAGQKFGETLDATGVSHSEDWRKKRSAADDLRLALSVALGDRYGQVVAKCSTELGLQRLHDGALRVRPFYSCRRRWCPVCSWRLSQKRWGMFVERLPDLIREQPPLRWLMLTLTVRNCATGDLHSSVKMMLAGFRKLVRRKRWPGVGWLRAVEVTFPRAGEAHPHIHVLIAVKSRYFKDDGYIKQAEWGQMWRECCKLDYSPVVDVRRVKPAKAEGVPSCVQEALGGLAEVGKYVTKPSDLSVNPVEAVDALASLRRVRLVEGGGFLRSIFSDADDDKLDLPTLETVAVFWWRAVERQYRRKL